MSLWAFDTGKKEGQKKNNRVFDHYPKYLMSKSGDHRFSDVQMDDATRLKIRTQLEEDRVLEMKKTIRVLGISLIVAGVLIAAGYVLFEFIYV